MSAEKKSIALVRASQQLTIHSTNQAELIDESKCNGDIVYWMQPEICLLYTHKTKQCKVCHGGGGEIICCLSRMFCKYINIWYLTQITRFMYTFWIQINFVKFITINAHAHTNSHIYIYVCVVYTLAIFNGGVYFPLSCSFLGIWIKVHMEALYKKWYIETRIRAIYWY